MEKTPLGRDGLLWSFGDVLVSLPIAVVGAWTMHTLFEKPLTQAGHRVAHRAKPYRAV